MASITNFRDVDVTGMTGNNASPKALWATEGNGRSGQSRSIPVRRRFPARKQSDVYAALDLGTNNCRLLIAKPAQNGLRVIDAFSRIVRLGEGLGHGHNLSEEAIERTLQALRICKDKLEYNNVTRARLVATEACRRAENGSTFVKKATDIIGLDLEIVDQKTEAFLAVAGCSSLIDPQAESSLVFDIGGGSTEIALVKGAHVASKADIGENIAAWTSLNAGVVTLAERYGGHDVSRELYEAMITEVQERLSDFARIAAGAEQEPHFHLLGTSGTVTTLGGIYLGLARYDRRRVDGLWMSERETTEIINRLIQMSYEERAAHPCINEERADLVLAGCAILDAIRRTFPTQFLRIADRGLREGILIKMMREDGVWPV